MDRNENFAILSFDGINLLVPQANVVTIEMSSSFERRAQQNGALGNLSMGNVEWPVFALDAKFNSLVECPKNYRYCVAVSINGAAAFSLACEEVGAVVVESEDVFDALQDCMRAPASPIESLLYRDERLLLRVNVDRMANYLSLEAAA
jgi:hypothetical protein